MRLRPYQAVNDCHYVEKWINDERTHALWCAGLIPYPISRVELEALLEQDAKEWGGSAFTATAEDGMPLGFFVYSVNNEENSGFLKFIVLNQELRGRGYGMQMLELALKYAFEITQVDWVQLNVFHVNEAARKCYAKVGFVEHTLEEAAFCYKGELWNRCNLRAYKKQSKILF